MSIRYNYNRQLEPPAPCAYVSIARPDNAAIVVANLPAQLDTGADITVVPAEIVERLQLVQLDQVAVGGFGGHVMLAATYLVRLSLHSFDAITIPVLADRDENAILLGRDALNRYRLLLDGPRGILEIQRHTRPSDILASGDAAPPRIAVVGTSATKKHIAATSRSSQPAGRCVLSHESRLESVHVVRTDIENAFHCL